MSEKQEREGRDPNNIEVFKTIGAPGTGKTTRIVGNPNLGIEGLFLQNSEKYPLEDQMLVTYTNSGVDEAADRLYRMTDFYKYEVEERVTTIHSRCYQLLDIERWQVVRFKHKNNFCKKFDLDFGYDDDDDDIMGADLDEGNALFRMYGWLQSNRLDISDWRECPMGWDYDNDPEWLMEQWDDHKKRNRYVGFGDMIEKVVEWGKKYLLDKGYGPLFPDDDITAREVFRSARDDSMLDQEKLRGTGPFVDTKVLYVDEVQDLTALQWAWYLMQKLVSEKVYIGGDDDQCLPPNAPVEVKPNPLMAMNENPETQQKPIKDVTVGEVVRTMESDGSYTFKRVNNVKSQTVQNKLFRRIETESGNTTMVTDNHKMFAQIPPADYEQVTDKHYVYLMRDNQNRWRIGETENLRQRMNVERGARCIIPLASFDTKQEALLKESQWSLEYSIPQVNIQEREGQAIYEDKDYRDKLYNNINPQYDLIEHDHSVDLSTPAFFKKATNRGRTESININIKMCDDVRGKEPFHRLSVYTSNEEAIESLSQTELNEAEAKNDSKRFRLNSTDITELGQIAASVRDTVGGDIITEMSPTDDRTKATVTPAGNLIEGMLIPVVDGESVVWEEIVEIEDQKADSKVYDLEVAETHNFTTNGICVHNSIYGWSGADPRYMLEEEGDFEVLETTYRIPKEIWEVCDGVIQQVDQRQEKDVTPNGDGGEFITYRNPADRQLMNHLTEGEWMILFRANYQIDEFRKSLHEYGIPYRNMSTFDTWSGDMITLRDGLAKLKNGDSSIRGDELQAMMDVAEDDMLKDDSDVSNHEKAMGKLGSGITRDRLEDIIEIKEHGRKRRLTPKNFLEATDDVDWYEQSALLGSINSSHQDLEPDRIRIGTIHSAKGKEAPNILVATDSTQTILGNMADEADEPAAGTSQVPVSDAERRVYYVGMSRASEKLILAERVTDTDYVIPINSLLSGDHTPDEWEYGKTQNRQP